MPLRLLQFPGRESRPPESSTSNGTLDEIERDAIVRALRSANSIVGGAKGAAAILGLKRTTLQSRMRKLGINTPKAAGHAEASVAPMAAHGGRS
jgi:transcriptional regulator with GAF, ATPase, and Fis domain